MLVQLLLPIRMLVQLLFAYLHAGTVVVCLCEYWYSCCMPMCMLVQLLFAYVNTGTVVVCLCEYWYSCCLPM